MICAAANVPSKGRSYDQTRKRPISFCRSVAIWARLSLASAMS
ncbi:hypothetical protein HMPREF1992_00913, partial [Selenomonas sp. oral taxon 892 str. F0426]